MSAARASAAAPLDLRRGLSAGRWRQAVDVRDSFVGNTRAYAGGTEFLMGPSPRTVAVRAHITPLLAEEIRRGVLDEVMLRPRNRRCADHLAGRFD